ncbi:MAG TPA: aminoglycoside phosphotransferase family protein [Gaiellaceae bacterium]|nr:aminoglycoside phosphotransferase family protein [Gaiellaceae bacterium]
MRELDERIERAVGSPPVRYEPRPGGYSTADRFAVTLADGRSVFVKSAEAPRLAEWLRREHEVYAALAGSFIPSLEGWDDDGVRPLLAIEDLSDADWMPRWDAARVEAVLEALEELADAVPPPNTPTVRESFAELFDRWRVIESDPAPFLSVGLRDAAWLDRALPVILAAVDSAPVSGDRVCHLDVRSDNLCFREGRAVLVDWNWTSLANPAADVAGWLPSVSVEGGPSPWEVMADGGALAAFIAGVWAAVAGLPPPETAPTVRDLQRRQLAVALDWVDRELL